MNRLVARATSLGVAHKIDETRGDDNEYIRRWMTLLDKFERFASECNTRPMLGFSLEEIDESDIVNYKSDVALLEQVKESLHEDHDGTFPTPHGKKGDTAFEKKKRHVDSNYGDEIKEDVHVIDVDYEYDYGTGMHIILYTRIINSDDTIFVRVPYHDYFYIEMTEELGAADIRKAVNDYCWYLKKNKYPKMANNIHPKADRRRHPCNMNVVEKPLVVKMEVVEDLKTMYGYQPDPQKFVKVTTVNPTVTNDLFNGLSKKYIGDIVELYKINGNTGEKFACEQKYFPEMRFYEANKTDVTNKFLTEYGISGCSAIRVTGRRHAVNGFSTCTIAVDASSIESLPDAPFYEPRTFFYDIECLALDINEFPTSDKCPVIQISYVCAKGRTVVTSGVLCLNETPGYEWFDNEAAMLIMFAKKIVDFNPDFLTGFNSNNFDMPYIIDRMKVLGVHDLAGCFSRRKGYVVNYKRDFKQSKQFGTKEVVTYTTPGRVMFDQMEIIKGNPMIRLRSYSLKAICAEFLGDDNKEDLKYRDIPDLFKTPTGRVKIASYCLQDSLLLKKLDDKMMLGVDIAGQAKVQGITTSTVLSRGLVHRIMCKIKQYTERYKFLIPTFTKKQFPVSPTYQGATVLNCDAGYYTDPVVVLDFASLYPSLIRSYNLDYTTIAKNSEQVQQYPERFQQFDNGYAFVKSEYHRGLLPRIEEELAVERTAAKKKMKQAKDDVEEAVWNAIQGGVKIVMNSIYGLSGSPTATVPCVPIASTITFLGRCNLAASKDYVEANYCRLTGETTPARVIYGDTDSIFILMPGIDNGTAIKYGQLLDNDIKTNLFGHLECLVMEYEKTYNPFIQVTPKRYAGYKMEFNPDKGKVAASGLQLVKRDSALLCKRTMQTFFDYLLVRKDKERALESLKVQISELYANNLELEDFCITKKISKKPEDYKTVPPHIVAWQRMVARVGVTEAPAVGERFEYIIEKFGKKDKLCNAIVDSDFVREKGFERFNIAKDHYFDLYIYNPMHVITELVYGKAMSDYVLDPKNYEQIETVSARDGNILGFFNADSVTKKRRFKSLGVDERLLQEIRQLRITDMDVANETTPDDPLAAAIEGLELSGE